MAMDGLPNATRARRDSTSMLVVTILPLIEAGRDGDRGSKETSVEEALYATGKGQRPGRCLTVDHTPVSKNSAELSWTQSHRHPHGMGKVDGGFTPESVN